MASTDSTSNNPNQIPFTQAKLQENFKEIPKKPEQRMTLINPIFAYPQLSLNQNNFGSNIVEKKNTIINFPQRINSSHSIKNNPEYDLFNQYSFVPHFPNVNFGMPIMSSQFKSYGLMNSFSHLKDERNLPLKINPNTFMLNSLVNENEEFYKDKKEENKNIIKTKEIFNEKDDEKNNNSEKSSSSEKNNSNNSNTNNLNNLNNLNNNSNNNNTNTGAINVPVQKLNAIENIANVLIQVIIALIAIAKIVIINLRLILILINVQQMSNLNVKRIMLFALVLKAVVIKIIVNVLK